VTCVRSGRRSNIALGTVESVDGWVSVGEEQLKHPEVREDSL
jgi:hypothetical protein